MSSRNGSAVRAALVVLLLPVAVVQAASFFVWNYDPADLFYDPQVADSVDCAYWARRDLVELGHSVTTAADLPADLTGYDGVFCLMGWFRC